MKELESTLEVTGSGGHWSRVRKMIIILGIAALLTWVMLSLASSTSTVAQACFPAYVSAMVVLGVAYVSETVLRIVAERLPLPFLQDGRHIEVK